MPKQIPPPLKPRDPPKLLDLDMTKVGGIQDHHGSDGFKSMNRDINARANARRTDVQKTQP